MKLILNLISLIQVYTYNLIDTTIRIPERPYYISKKIEDKSEIYNAVNEYNRFSYFYPALVETNNKEKSHIRIQYDSSPNGLGMGGTYMSADTNSGGYFELAKTVISFSDKLNGNVLQCVMLHEILHTQMIYHNWIAGSIMNFSVSITQDGDIIQETVPCKLNVDDIIGLMSVNN
jgi:hypothetical protein